jgi:hypothetical protein
MVQSSQCIVPTVLEKRLLQPPERGQHTQPDGHDAEVGGLHRGFDQRAPRKARVQ